MSEYITIRNLEVYKLSREIGKVAWRIYKKLDWRLKKIMGDQFISAIDSIGANIAEGYGRFHYLDKIKFLNFIIIIMSVVRFWRLYTG